MISKKVLIIGAQGTLGQSLVDEYSQAEYTVVAWDREDLDVTLPGADEQIIAQKPDILIYSVGYNAVDKAETDDAETAKAILLNSTVPGRLAALSKKIGAIFVHYSTNYVFSGEDMAGYAEDSPVSPVNKYGQSKAEGEKLVSASGAMFYLIRLSRLFGIRGASPSSKRTFIDVMMSEIDKPELAVGNTEVATPTYSPDLARLTRELTESGRPWGIYHGTNSGSCTWYEWAVEIFKDFGRGPKVIPADHSLTPHTTKHPQYAVLLNTKLPSQRSWQSALQEFINTLSK